MMVKAARRQARIIEVPVSHHVRRAGKSKVSGDNSRINSSRVLHPGDHVALCLVTRKEDYRPITQKFFQFLPVA